MPFYVVKLLKPVAANADGIYDMICQPLRAAAPAGRRVRMQAGDALEAARAGHVEMLSPDGKKTLEVEVKTQPRKKATYKTRVETPDGK